MLLITIEKMMIIELKIRVVKVKEFDAILKDINN